jgi:hypothetical protein
MMILKIKGWFFALENGNWEIVEIKTLYEDSVGIVGRVGEYHKSGQVRKIPKYQLL